MSKHGQQTRKKVFIPAIEIKIENITAENCTPSIPPDSGNSAKYFTSVVKNNNQIHHNMECPKELQEDGKFEMVFPFSVISPINETLGDDGISKSHSLHMDMCGRYDEYYKSIVSEVESIMSSLNEKSSPEDLKSHLFTSLKERKKSTEEIQKYYDANISKVAVLTLELYKQVAIAVLIQDKLNQDTRYLALLKVCQTIKDSYCDWLDAKENYKYKLNIFTEIGLPDKAVDEETALVFNDLFHYTKYTEIGPLKGKIDYSKSPAIPFKLLSSIPKPEDRKDDHIIISEAGHVLWTKIIDRVANPFATLPIKTAKEFSRMTYMKGESSKGSKAYFKQIAMIKTLPPTAFWGQVQKTGSLQLKIASMEVSQHIPIARGVKELNQDEVRKRQDEAREAMLYFGTFNTQPLEQAQLDLPDLNDPSLGMSTTEENEKKRKDDSRDANDSFLTKKVKYNM